MKWLLVFVFVSGERLVLAEMVERGDKGHGQCYGLASTLNRVAEDAAPNGKPDYRASCEPKR